MKNTAKTTLCAALLMAACTQVSAQGGKYTIKGQVSGADGQTVYLVYDRQPADSAIVKKGKFTFKGIIDKACQAATLVLGNQPSRTGDNRAQLYIEPTTITVKGTAQDFMFADIKGGKVQAELNELTVPTREDMKQLIALNQLYYQQGANRDSIMKLIQPYSQHYQQVQQEFLKNHPSSYLAPGLIEQKMGRLSYDELKAAFDALGPEVQQSDEAKKIRTELDALEKQRPGLQAPVFTANDINGKPFSLSDVRGKVVILDFWASWCQPCRRSNPHMRELYKKYHPKGLELVYVASDDGAEDKWRKAVEDDKLQGEGYHHVLEGFDRKFARGTNPNCIGDMYAVHYLPTKFLIDRDGKIVGKVESDEWLDEQLERLLGKAEYPFAIEGSIANAEGKKVLLSYDKDRQDSTIVSGGKFSFKGALKGLYSGATLILGNFNPYSQDNDYRQIALEPGTLTVDAPKGTLKDATISGNPTQDELNAYEAVQKPLEAQFIKLNDQLNKAKTDKQRKAIETKMAPLRQQFGQLSTGFYTTHPDSYLSPYYMRFDTGRMTYDELKSIYGKFTERVRLYGDTDEIEKELDALAHVQPGSPAPDFTAKDIQGQDFTLSSLKGKVVIIDFWASWCVPCRKSNPHMLELYKKYHDRGLDLVYVSDDDSNPDKWRQAVEQDQLTGDGFHHVLRGLKWDRSKGGAGFDHTNDISDKYAIHFLPTKYLIDREGKIVCKIDEGQDQKLDETLEQLLK